MPGVQIKEVEVRGVLAKSDLPCDMVANPYVGCAHRCRYCYAAYMKKYTNHGEPWGEFVDVKRWPEPTGLHKLAGKEVMLSSVTDAYQPAEAEYGRTRALLEQLRGCGCRLSILTKSDLVLRDLELIRSFPEAQVAWSINTLDEGFREDMDRAASIGRRLAAMQEFYAAGVRTACFVAPMFPGITDAKAIIRRVRKQCHEVWLDKLNLRGEYQRSILAYVRRNFPRLTPLYDALYRRGDNTYWRELDAELRAFAAAEGLPYLHDKAAAPATMGDGPTIVCYFGRKGR